MKQYYVIRDSKEDAISKLKQAGLIEPKIETKNDDNVEAGKVISQSVEYGTEVDEGTQITIVISLGPANFDMPDVTGKDIDEARSVLSSKGLTVTVSYESSSSVAKNKVIRQSISAGTKVKKGDSIKLTVSSGVSTITVPYVVGQSKSSAVSALESAGFKTNVVEKYSSSVAKDKVISQSPSAGSSQAKNTMITLYVSKGAEPIVVPDKIIKVTLDANGGYVSPSYITINLSDSSTYSNLPTPTRDYYRYTGWYTSDGTKVSNVSAVAYESDHTLYAHWKDNVSDWIKESEVPSGAQIVDTKWEYTLTEYTTSNSLLYGQTEWTLYDSKTSWSDYGNWSGWSANYLANSDSRQVESQSVVTSYTIKGYCCGNSSGIRCYLKYLQPGYTLRLEYPERVISKSDFANWTAYGEGSWFGYAPNVQGRIIGPGTGYEDPDDHVIYFITNTNYETQYRYRERHKITTYYYQKTSTKTSSYDPTGQSGVYDVVKYVKYRAK